jgi:ATP-dependent RNA helicase RhlE
MTASHPHASHNASDGAAPAQKPAEPDVTFDALNLHPDLLRGIRDLGFIRPTPIQAQAIPPILAGRDVIGCAQTGTGKTAAFVLPILHRLLLNKSIFGGVPMDPQISALARGVDIISATPGRLLDHIYSGRIDFVDLEVLVLDEADRMLDMGFLPDIQSCGSCRRSGRTWCSPRRCRRRS